MAQGDGHLRVFLTHRSALIDYASPILGSRAQAEDVVQEAYLRFSASPENDLRMPVAYLYSTVRNLALDAIRRRSAENRRDAAYAETIDPAATEPSPEETTAHREELARVAAILAELPELKRLAFEMSRFGGLTFQEIGERLGVSTASAHRFAHETLTHLMRRMRR